MSARASIVVESQGIRGQRILLSLLLFFAFLVCASMHKVAQARALGLSAQVSAEAEDRDQTALLQRESAAPQCAENHAAPPFAELDAIETEDTELDARVDTVLVVVAALLAHLGPDVGQTPPVVAEALTDKFWVTSALPRGPPATHR